MSHIIHLYYLYNYTIKMLLYVKCSLYQLLTTPMASRANRTVPKKSGKFVTSPNATRFSNDTGSRKI